MRADCTAGPLPAIRLSVTPEHGAVTVRRATLKATNVKQCLAAELPALVALYRPKADFANDDRFELEVSFATGANRSNGFTSSFRMARAKANGFSAGGLGARRDSNEATSSFALFVDCFAGLAMTNAPVAENVTSP